MLLRVIRFLGAAVSVSMALMIMTLDNPPGAAATVPIPFPVMLLTPKPSTSPSPSPSPAPTPSTTTLTLPSRGAVFAMSLSSDPSLNARISLEMVRALRPKLGGTWVIPEPTWALTDYYNQCQGDRNTLGAVVVLPAATRNANEGYVLVNRSWTQLDLVLVALDCQDVSARPRNTPSDPPPTTSPGASPTSPTPVPRNAIPAYVTDVQSGIGSRNVANILPLAGLFAALQATRPSSTETKTSTTSYVAPGPSPSPGTAYTSSNVDQTVTNKNSSNDFTVLGTTLFTQLSNTSVTIGSSSSADAQIAKAAERAAGSLVNELIKSNVIVSWSADGCAPVSSPPRLCWIYPSPKPAPMPTR